MYLDIAKETVVTRAVKHHASNIDTMAANFETQFRDLKAQIVGLTALNPESVVLRIAKDTEQIRASIDRFI